MQDHRQAIHFLRCNPLRNIVLLKMLTAHPHAVQSYYHQVGDDAGVLLLLPTHAFAYDRQTYPTAQQVVILTAAAPSVVTALLPAIPTGCTLVFKLMDDDTRRVIAEHFVLERVRAFISYTGNNASLFRLWHEVVIAKTVDERCYPLFTTQGLAPDEVVHYFADGKAHSFTLYEHNDPAGEPIAACLTYQNFEQVYEIGGVFTIERERLKGHARKIVETALHTLLQTSCIPRYNVHEANRPSIHLAESLGLQPFVVVEHWLHNFSCNLA